MSEAEKIIRAARLIERSQTVVAFTGAGVSTPSGIPDFRSLDSGLWTHSDPMAVASIFGFRENPQAFYEWVYPLAKKTKQAEPNPAHYALSRLEHRGKLQGIITQNIDMLHTLAGNKCVYELHGHMREVTCIQCYAVFPGEPIMEKFLTDRKVPICQMCGGVIKPNVILFGEQLPYQAFEGAQRLCRQADLMIVIGSSLEVEPAGELPILAYRTGARLIIINIQPTDLDKIADVTIHEDAAIVLPQLLEAIEKTLYA